MKPKPTTAIAIITVSLVLALNFIFLPRILARSPAPAGISTVTSERLLQIDPPPTPSPNPASPENSANPDSPEVPEPAPEPRSISQEEAIAIALSALAQSRDSDEDGIINETRVMTIKGQDLYYDVWEKRVAAFNDVVLATFEDAWGECWIVTFIGETTGEMRMRIPDNMAPLEVLASNKDADCYNENEMRSSSLTRYDDGTVMLVVSYSHTRPIGAVINVATGEIKDATDIDRETLSHLTDIKIP